MTSIDVLRRLPPFIAIKSVDNELYRIGCLCRSPDQTNDDRGKGRDRIHHPILVNVVLLIQLTKSVLSLTLDNRTLAIYLGDYAKLIGLGDNAHISISLWALLNIGIHVIHGYNHILGVDPSFLRVFQI